MHSDMKLTVKGATDTKHRLLLCLCDPNPMEDFPDQVSAKSPIVNIIAPAFVGPWALRDPRGPPGPWNNSSGRNNYIGHWSTPSHPGRGP